MISIRHPALDMTGPGSPGRRTAQQPSRTLASKGNRGEEALARQMYDWKARNAETFLFQVRGKSSPFDGVSLPSFLPETR